MRSLNYSCSRLLSYLRKTDSAHGNQPFPSVRCLALCLRRLQIFVRFFIGGFYFDDAAPQLWGEVGASSIFFLILIILIPKLFVEYKIVVAHVWFNNCIL